VRGGTREQTRGVDSREYLFSFSKAPPPWSVHTKCDPKMLISRYHRSAGAAHQADLPHCGAVRGPLRRGHRRRRRGGTHGQAAVPDGHWAWCLPVETDTTREGSWPSERLERRHRLLRRQQSFAHIKLLVVHRFDASLVNGLCAAVRQASRRQLARGHRTLGTPTSGLLAFLQSC
jgi:hypothetical protein